jgi:hypothetical protein
VGIVNAERGLEGIASDVQALSSTADGMFAVLLLAALAPAAIWLLARREVFGAAALLVFVSILAQWFVIYAAEDRFSGQPWQTFALTAALLLALGWAFAAVGIARVRRRKPT